MQLREWIEKTKSTQADFAKSLGVSLSMVEKLCQGRKRPGGALARKIDRLTDGAVSRFEMRPDIFGPCESDAA